VIGSTHHPSAGTASLLADIGGGDRIREFVTRFYARAFLDTHIKDFFFLDDGATAHAKRLADWIIQKMGGEGEPWTDSGRWGMRQPSHHAAWHSHKRDPALVGQRFKLDDCRIWMRLHFCAARECGLHEHEPFWEWYVQFIEHFIAVYERSAPRYAAEDAEWSADPRNLAAYEASGHLMRDVIGRH
jgi:truncated hemoglobin YjbI